VRRRLLILYLVFAVVLCFAGVGKLMMPRAEHPAEFSLYAPDTSDPRKPQDYGYADMRVIKVTTKGGLEMEAWFQPPKAKSGKVIIFFPGNAETLASEAYMAQFFLPHGYGMYLCAYPGYGLNPGKPSEESLYENARAGFRWLKEQGYKQEDIIIFGESLGAGVGVQMALEFSAEIMILASSFTNIPEVLQSWHVDLPKSVIEKERYDNLSKIKGVHARILVVHGELDTLIPIAIAQKLYNAANEPKEFMMISGSDHNELFLHNAGNMMADWLDKAVVETGN
jgi:uncharacterized protein